MNTCFLLTHIPDPKTNKRIKLFKSKGNVSVICTRRKSQDIYEPVFDDIKHYIYDVDLPTVQHLFKRFLVSNSYQKKALLKLYEVKPDCIYADGLDSLLIAEKFKKKHNLKLFYDVADLRETYIEKPKGLLKRIVINKIKRIEKRCFKLVDYLVITSEKFYSVYYKKLISEDRVIFLPNVPDRTFFSGYSKKRGGPFTIGFIGGIRYLDQMKMLVDAAGICGCKVLFAGAGGTSHDYEEISSYCRNKDWVNFTGKYDYNSEIANLYGRVDCIYAVYNADNPNVRIALPNKLYESIYCRLPIIVAKGTYLSELVEKWGVGVSVNHKNIDELINVIRWFMSDEKRLKEFELNSLKIVDEIVSDKYMKQLEEII